MKDDAKQDRIVRIVGLAADGDDGHIRITRGNNFNVYLGSERTHDEMQGVCLKINEKLSERGCKLEDLSRDEFIELVSSIE